MGSIIKVNEYKDFNNNAIITSDGAGAITLSSGMQTAVGNNTPAFLATPSATQTIANTTFTKMTFDTEVLDTDSAYDASASTFTVPSGKGGVYIFYCNMRMPLSDGEERTHMINVNGSNDLKTGTQFYPGNNAPFYSTATQMLNLSAGDVCYQNVYVTSSGTRTTNISYTYFGAYKLNT
jgi:hypothetical protein